MQPRLAAQAPVPPTTPRAVASVALDVVVVDKDGGAVDGLRAGDFVVTVDGKPRRVLSVRHVSRGPGASSEASTRAARQDPSVVLAAEAYRNVLMVVDQATLPRGDEKTTVQAAGAFLDRLGLSDRVAVVRLPMTASTSVELSTERPAARDVLRGVVGQQAVRAGGDPAPAPPDPTQAVVADPDKTLDPDKQIAAREQQRQQQVGGTDPTSPAGQADVPKGFDSMAGLRELFRSLAQVPGRKTLILLTTGLPPGWKAAGVRLEDLAYAAAAARTVVHGFVLRATHVDEEPRPDPSPIESLARMTGGAFAQMAKNPDQTVERVMPELGACYVLGLESAPGDGDGKRRALKVETTRRGLTLRAPSFLAPRADPDDVSVPTAGPRAASPTSLRESPEGARQPSSGVARDPGGGRDTDLQMLLSRVAEYVDSYQRAFSAVVAEEIYDQTTRGGRVRLRSDFLLVRPDTTSTWVSFRDVFEVDGAPVRDRDDRLRKLFLERTNTELRAQLAAIRAESARYNIGPVERNVNVPMFPFAIVRADNQMRFRFKLGKKGDTDGVETRRIEYEERAHPTLVASRNGKELPVNGWFLLDPLTGAIVETGMELEDAGMKARYTVKFRRDPSLGLWAPASMDELYLTTLRGDVQMQAKATYSRFRRFQVKTEEKIVIAKQAAPPDHAHRR
jgi:VWFA-related protein